MPQHITLSELQSLIKRGIDDAHPLPYWVTAEISELKVNYSGHCYLELVEKGGANHVPKAKISAVIWRSTYGMIASYFGASTGGQTLCAGLKVLVKALVSYHELYGLSLQITDIDPSYTLGDMERQRRQTIEQLQRDGVFDMNRELPMPAVVQRLAVVSSRNAAGYQDFMKELSSGPYRFEVTLFDAFMQGAESEESIVRALETVADALDDFDAVVLIRGGGSQSDLGSFDSYRLCCHLAQFPLPVIAGIGHDKDRSVADLESPLAKVKMDIQRIPFPDGEFDVIFCNHILEHVDDDRRAMREMYRVMRPGGWGIMLSPVNMERETTYEDPSITDPAERERHFGQKDHLRDYGRDYGRRLSEAGFDVEEIDYVRSLSPEAVKLYGLRSEIVYVVRKRSERAEYATDRPRS